MLKSMTGFGVGEAPYGKGRISLEVRSVNHRFLDVRVRVPRELGDHGTFLEQAARGKLNRGRVDIGVRAEGTTSDAVVLDKRRAREAFKALDELRQELGLEGAVPLSLLASVPELFSAPSEENPELVRSALQKALDLALVGLESMRTTEGEALGRDLAERLAVVRELAIEVTTISEGSADRYRKRLRDRIARMLQGADFSLDSGRLEQEVALLAEHSDITEELTRLSSHTVQFAAMLAAEEPVGRKMDFLLQEMAREVNTIGSKANEADIALRVVELKAELERMREQVQNVE